MMILLLAFLSACTDTTLEGSDCSGALEGESVAMNEMSSVGQSADDLTTNLQTMTLSVTWTDGPLTGEDTLTLASEWTDARDVEVVAGCEAEARAGLYVSGTTTMTSASGALEASGGLELWFPLDDTEAFEFVTAENGLPLESNPELESAADEAYGDAGDRLWISAWLSRRDSIGIDASYGGDDVVKTGHVQVGTIAVE